MYAEKDTERYEISLFQLALVKKVNFLKILRPLQKIFSRHFIEKAFFWNLMKTYFLLM